MVLGDHTSLISRSGEWQSFRPLSTFQGGDSSILCFIEPLFRAGGIPHLVRPCIGYRYIEPRVEQQREESETTYNDTVRHREG